MLAPQEKQDLATSTADPEMDDLRHEIRAKLERLAKKSKAVRPDSSILVRLKKKMTRTIDTADVEAILVEKDVDPNRNGSGPHAKPTLIG